MPRIENRKKKNCYEEESSWKHDKMQNLEYNPLDSQSHIRQYEKQTLSRSSSFFTGKHLDSRFVLHHHSSWHWLWLKQDFFFFYTSHTVQGVASVVIYRYYLKINTPFFRQKNSCRGRDTFRVISYFYNWTIITFSLLSYPSPPLSETFLSVFHTSCNRTLLHQLLLHLTPFIDKANRLSHCGSSDTFVSECSCLYVCLGRNRLITMGGGWVVSLYMTCVWFCIAFPKVCWCD